MWYPGVVTPPESATGRPFVEQVPTYSGLTMNHTTLLRFSAFTLPALLGFASCLRADDSIQVSWNELCNAAKGRQLLLVTTEGQAIQGYCLTVDVDGVSVGEPSKPVRLARAAIAKIQALPVGNNKHHLRALGRNLRGGLKQGAEWMFSEWAPLGIVTIPAVLGWTAASAPFCLLNDLVREEATPQTIQVK